MIKEFNQSIETLTQSLVSIFEEDPAYTAIISTTLPSREDILELIRDIRKVLYPKHFSAREYSQKTIHYYVGSKMMQIEQTLTQQVQLALLRKCEHVDCAEVSIKILEQSQDISYTFMQKLPMIREMMTMDVQAAYDGDPAAADLDQIILSYPGVFAMMVYRIAHELYLLKVPLIPRMMSEYAHSRTGIDINPGATIGRYFFMDHGTGIVIGQTTEIGDYVKLYQGVTLGALSTRGGQTLRGKKRHPTIRDNVTIYSNVSILGGDTIIGHDSVIGGSAFITQSIPPYSKVSIKNPELHVEAGKHCPGIEDPEA